MVRQVHFDGFVVDLDTRTVGRDGAAISLEPQVFDVLALLLEHRDRVVTKLELLDAVWGDRFVSPATLTSRIRDLRAALGDSGRSQHVIKTVHGRGFRFVAAVETGPRHDPVRGVPPLKPLIGRDELLADVRRRLTTSRLVTLVGPGGAGKTHLMRHTVAELDAIITDLTDVREGDALVRTVLDAAAGTEQPDADTLEAVVRLLRGRGKLLVLDNCEHVIDAATSTAAELLRRCDELRILATSRRPLRLGDESVVRVGPLDSSAATELLVGHARRHGVELDPHDAALEQLCERLDRLPLALELAASKTRAISLDDLARLLDGRFGVLTADLHDASEHHASLDTTIRWSVDLLTPRQRQLFACLGVFVGSFELAAVEAVCAPRAGEPAATVADLMALVDLSLVQFDPRSGTYRLLESIRMFAESLGVPAVTRVRYRDHVLSTVEAAAAMRADTFSADLATIRSAWPAVRAVAAAAREEQDPATLHRLVAAVGRYAEQTFSFEVLDWADAAIALDDVTEPGSHVVAAILCAHRSDFDAASRHLARSEGADPAMVELARLWFSYFTGDLAAADAATARIRELDPAAASYAGLVGLTAQHFLDKGAQRTFDPAAVARVDAWASGGDPAAAAGAALCASLRLDWEVDAERAVEELTETIDRARRLGLAFLASGAMTARSIVLAISPAAESSARVLRATLRSYAEVGSWQFALADFAAAALSLAEHGRARDAAELLGARRAAGYVGDSSAGVEQAALAITRRSLGDPAFEDALRQGSARDTPTAVRLALAAFDRIVSD